MMRAAISTRVRLLECSVGSPLALFVGTLARSSVFLTVVAGVIVFAGGLFLGYVGTPPVQVQTASLVNQPAPVINMPAPVINTPAPAINTPAPVINTPAPVINIAPPLVQVNWEPNFRGRTMSYYQRYTCDKFGPACRIALAIQAAENLKGNCEAYHHNSDGTLDWGYFQINSIHLTRRGLNLRDLLDCKANIDFAYRLYTEEGFQPWSTFVGGKYRKFLDDSLPNGVNPRLRRRPEPLLMPAGLSSQSMH